MEIIETPISGLLIIKPKIFKDDRGYFFESYNKRNFQQAGIDVDFVQDNESCSVKGVVRGLHFQKPPYAQSKLVRCVKGKVLDIALDIRKDSATYGQYYGVELSEDNFLQFFIPKGFAHGFAVLSDIAIFQYKCDNFYHPESESGIYLFDEDLKIDWKLDGVPPILSEKDKRNQEFKNFMTPFD